MPFYLSGKKTEEVHAKVTWNSAVKNKPENIMQVKINDKYRNNKCLRGTFLP